MSAPELRPDLDPLLATAAAVMEGDRPIPAQAPIRVGVDLGTAYTVVLVTDPDGTPLAGAYRFADVVRDGVVWDFAGAVGVVRSLVADVQRRTGRELATAAVTIPPGVSEGSHRAHRYVVEGCGLDCTALADEPTAANAVLRVRNGAVVDLGGGTTGTAIIVDGQVVATADEPTGGTHLSLVIAGHLRIGFDEAERRKRDPANHRELFPVVVPTLEKMATIVGRHVAGHDVGRLYLVGGTAAFTGIEAVFEEVTGIPTTVPTHPLFVTPLGAAGFDTAVPSSAEHLSVPNRRGRP